MRFLAHGWPFPLALLKASLITALVGALVGLPAMRMTGIYLAIATMATTLQRIVHVAAKLPGAEPGGREEP